MRAMARLDQLLYPQCEPAAPLQAATLLLLRDGAQGGWEVLMTRRSDKASFVPGAYVFPGGCLEPQDANAHHHVLHRTQMPASELHAAIAAVRETFEEMGVLLAAHADGTAATEHDVQSLDRQAPLWPQLAQCGLQLDVRAVWQLAHWTTNRNLPKRFAVPFFVARMPPEQTPVADEQEQFDAVWVTPELALQRFEQGQMPMIFPTLRTLRRLQRYACVQDVLDAVAHGPLWESIPRIGSMHGQAFHCMEGDSAYGELAMVCPAGPAHHELAWQSERAVPLRKNVLRLTAANANVMTGPGTNSYLVGDALVGYIAIDPGPADLQHIERLLEAAQGNVQHIVCTHSHPDHAPGAFLLQALCAKRGLVRPLIYGISSASTSRADSRFVPDVELADGACLSLHTPGSAKAQRHTLHAVHTPGHAANHVCLWLQEDGLLFSGDHVLNGSTTVINPPDGDMTDYLHSLDVLLELCQREGVQFLLPAHGYVLDQPAQVIAQLKAHRLAREAKVIAAMRAQPEGSLQDWVAVVYADAPQALWKIAERSLLAHVQRIRALGLAHV